MKNVGFQWILFKRKRNDYQKGYPFYVFGTKFFNYKEFSWEEFQDFFFQIMFGELLRKNIYKII